MNSKLIKASLAGAAAIAVVAGGTTLATYSDFAQVTGNKSGAGILRLNMNGTDTLKFENVRLAPSDGDEGPYNYYERKVFIASSDGASVPNGNLSLTYSNFQSKEDNGTAAALADGSLCTTLSEKIAEGGVTCGATGEFADQSTFRARYSDPVLASTIASSADCDVTAKGTSLIHNTYATSSTKALDAVTGTVASDPSPTVNLGTAIPAGKGVCVLFEVSLPVTATNASQGDSMSWDTQFDLAQTITH
jgi:hypothetical protein